MSALLIFINLSAATLYILALANICIVMLKDIDLKLEHQLSEKLFLMPLSDSSLVHSL